MKLSEMLTEQAEWWIIEGEGKTRDVEEQDKLWHTASNAIMRAEYGLDHTPWVLRVKDCDSRCYLCLLESEYQKDIEIAKEIEELDRKWEEYHEAEIE